MAIYKVSLVGSYHDLEEARAILQEHRLAVGLLPPQPSPKPRRRRAGDADVAESAVEMVVAVISIAGNLASIAQAIIAVKGRVRSVGIGEPELDDRAET